MPDWKFSEGDRCMKKDETHFSRWSMRQSPFQRFHAMCRTPARLYVT